MTRFEYLPQTYPNLIWLFFAVLVIDDFLLLTSTAETKPEPPVDKDGNEYLKKASSLTVVEILGGRCYVSAYLYLQRATEYVYL